MVDVISRHERPTDATIAAECGADWRAIRPAMDRLMRAGRLAMHENVASPTSPFYEAV